MRILVTGAEGFVGGHLATDLSEAGHDVILTDLSPRDQGHLALNICDYDQCKDVLRRYKPESVIHLAGIAQTTGIDYSTLDKINIQGTLNVAKAYSSVLRENSSKGLFLFISSAFVYGGSHKTGTYYCNETTPTDPRGDYGRSKLTAEIKLKELKDPGFTLYIARPFNHIGPAQSKSFVLPGLASRIKEAPLESFVRTGNLESIRDFTDVRDVVRAYRLIIEKMPKEQVFVIASGMPVKIRSLFEHLNLLSGKNLKSEVNTQLLRNEGEAIFLGDAHLAQSILGWKPNITLEKSIRDVWNEYQ